MDIIYDGSDSEGAEFLPLENDIEHGWDNIPNEKPDIPDSDLLRDFHQVLTLYHITGPLKKTAPRANISSPVSEDQDLWHKFLDQLAWQCDKDTGGESVTAIAAQKTTNISNFWVASKNGKTEQATVDHLNWVLLELQSLNKGSNKKDVENSIFQRSVEFSHAKVKNYARTISVVIKESIEFTKDKSSPEDEALWDELIQLRELEFNHHQLCSTTYHRRFRLTTTPKKPIHEWSKICHYIGRLGSWMKAAKILVRVAMKFPERITNCQLDTVTPPPGHRQQLGKSVPDLHGIVRRIFPHPGLDSSLVISRLLKSYKKKDGTPVDVEKEFYKGFKRQPHVHAETLVAALFLAREFEFVGDDRYIGISKPSCYCCDKFLRHSSEEITFQKPHGNVYNKWVPPPAFELDSEHGLSDSTREFLQSITEEMIQDLSKLFYKRGEAKTSALDSITGITASMKSTHL